MIKEFHQRGAKDIGIEMERIQDVDFTPPVS
jgi:hypothetical protein